MNGLLGADLLTDIVLPPPMLVNSAMGTMALLSLPVLL